MRLNDVLYSSPKVDLRVGSRHYPALALRLGGQQAALALTRQPPKGAAVSLVLDWEDGTRTILDAHVARVLAGGCVTELDLYGVRGDWRPWVEYLGRDVA
jgi:hypothetical protein